MNGKLLFKARRRDELRRVQLKDSLAHEELKEGSESGELSGDRSFLFLRGVQCGEPFADGDVVNLPYINVAAHARLLIGRRDVVQELQEVAHVVGQRVLAHVAPVP